jgi:hypothetical protein
VYFDRYMFQQTGEGEQSGLGTTEVGRRPRGPGRPDAVEWSCTVRLTAQGAASEDAGNPDIVNVGAILLPEQYAIADRIIPTNTHSPSRPVTPLVGHSP